MKKLFNKKAFALLLCLVLALTLCADGYHLEF